MASTSEQIDKSLQAVASAMEAMGATSRDIAKNTAESARLSASAVETLTGADETIAHLAQSSEAIGEVVSVITTIASQTAMVALNATIEAARAGAAGEGFAVVADEVRALAEKTAAATRQIGDKVAMIKRSSGEAATTVADIKQVVATVNSIATAIAGAAEEQSVTTAEVGRDMQTSAAGSAGIVADLRGVADASKRSADSAGVNRRAATDLTALAETLKTLVDRFQIGDRRAA